MPADPYGAAQDAAAFLAAATGHDHQVGVVLGSGWGPAADQLGEATVALPMDDVPGFTVPSIPGHAGAVSSIDCSGRRVLVLAGRSHLYEGHSPAAVVHGVRTAVLAGCRVLILTNAAGSLRPDWRVGQPVLIADHLNLTGHSPLVGPPPPEGFPPRFADLTAAYSPRLRAAARELDPTLAEGVYAALLGGSYETPAEIQMLRRAGADLVGMSTALETIAAVHLGAEVLGVSLVTNLAAGLSAGPIDHREVLAAGAGAAGALGRLLRSVIERV